MAARLKLKAWPWLLHSRSKLGRGGCSSSKLGHGGRSSSKLGRSGSSPSGSFIAASSQNLAMTTLLELKAWPWPLSRDEAPRRRGSTSAKLRAPVERPWPSFELAVVMVDSYDEAPEGPGDSEQRWTSSRRAMAE
ncbi:hypothetical protein NL676_002225 [Syzygium grande]|nr:hypothetical protein NL676_002225 [Syzygium grande]